MFNFLHDIEQKSQYVWKTSEAYCQSLFFILHPWKSTRMVWGGAELLTSSSLGIAFVVQAALLLVSFFPGCSKISASLDFLSCVPKGWAHLQSVLETWSLSWISAEKPLEMNYADTLLLLRKYVIHT